MNQLSSLILTHTQNAELSVQGLFCLNDDKQRNIKYVSTVHDRSISYKIKSNVSFFPTKIQHENCNNDRTKSLETKMYVRTARLCKIINNRRWSILFLRLWMRQYQAVIYTPYTAMCVMTFDLCVPTKHKKVWIIGRYKLFFLAKCVNTLCTDVTFT